MISGLTRILLTPSFSLRLLSLAVGLVVFDTSFSKSDVGLAVVDCLIMPLVETTFGSSLVFSSCSVLFPKHSLVSIFGVLDP